MTEDQPENDECVFDDEQQQRSHAVRVAREVLGKRAFMSGELGDAGVVDVVDLAEYIVNGTHPYDRGEAPIYTPTPGKDA